MKKNFVEYLLPVFGYIAIIIFAGIITIIALEGLPLLSKFSFFSLISGTEWRPTSLPPLFGFLPSIVSTFFVAIFSMLIAIPLSLGTAIYLSKIATPKIRNVLKPTIELLANIPSVIYGAFALLFLGPLIKRLFNLPVGLNGLNASIILAIMSIPTITTLSDDAISMVPKEEELASYALGASNLETIFGITIPSASAGIFASITAGFGRAVGETMAVLLASGNSIRIPHSILEPMRPITATIALEMAEAPVGGDHYRALFMLALILLILVLSFNLLSRHLKAIYRRKLYG
ncbi:phosphate ABC transporter permease subunit PstC [Caldisericum exile]|uniref:Phosphate transport system permease protein n=1 Tax=Caldisericum exile (strain DSM 21853 / NBRC 104410 / AZM16c01) TaxID=511051 RepID=A0A7U6GE49_CALEA|nr:phosphate ABC transporter permease subunit PstC [Caldisericum exile]BAL80724.1 phosphate ABC transporter permease protein [Caldisericum exile AZM16c01]